jgi:hypothetical protein
MNKIVSKLIAVIIAAKEGRLAKRKAQREMAEFGKILNKGFIAERKIWRKR